MGKISFLRDSCSCCNAKLLLEICFLSEVFGGAIMGKIGGLSICGKSVQGDVPGIVKTVAAG